jgi:hypothetical protein
VPRRLATSTSSYWRRGLSRPEAHRLGGVAYQVTWPESTHLIADNPHDFELAGQVGRGDRAIAGHQCFLHSKVRHRQLCRPNYLTSNTIVNHP